MIGVNTFLAGGESHAEGGEIGLMHSSDEEKHQQVGNVEAIRDAHKSAHKACFTKPLAQTGAVTLIQRFGSALNLNIH